MKKLQLDCEDLEIESFPTAAVSAELGTVQARAAATLPSCLGPVCGQTYDDTLCGISRGC